MNCLIFRSAAPIAGLALVVCIGAAPEDGEGAFRETP